VLAGIPIHKGSNCTLSLGQTDEPPREARAMPIRLPLLLKGLVRVVVSVMVPLWLRLMAPPAPALPQIADPGRMESGGGIRSGYRRHCRRRAR
jgi:hypothetical protein